MEDKKCGIILTGKERKLIETLRGLPYGEVVIFVQNNEPVRIERVKESIKL